MDKKTNNIFGVGYPLNVKVEFGDFRNNSYEKLSLVDFVKKFYENTKSPFTREFVLDEDFQQHFLPRPLDVNKKSDAQPPVIISLHVCALDFITRYIVENFPIEEKIDRKRLSSLYTLFILHFISLELICEPSSKQSKLMYRLRRKFYYFFSYMNQMGMCWEKQVKLVLAEVDDYIKRNREFYTDGFLVIECNKMCDRYHKWFINYEKNNDKSYKRIINETVKSLNQI